MLRQTTLTVLLVLVFGCAMKGELPRTEPDLGAEAAHSALAQKAVLADYVRTHYMSPEEYVISKFEEHDIVCIGEQHRIKHDVELIQRIIPELYENGIYTLGTEFGLREDQARIDSLLNAPAWDEALARQITFNQSVTWGFREYVDVYRAAWQLNQGLPEGARRFRILGLGDSLDWSVIQKPEDRNDPAIMKKVWQGQGEHLWAKVILDEVIARGEKALTYSGIHHAFTQYRQPNWSIEKQKLIRFEDRRMGNFLYREIGKRAITIYLHAPWNSAEGWEAPMVQPADGIIESVMAELEPEYIPIGFDTKGTPFGRLPGETSMYMYGYEDFTLETFCDGYIYQMPISEFRGVTPIQGFINEDNIEYARLQMPNPGYRHVSIEQFNTAIAADADIPRRFANVR